MSSQGYFGLFYPNLTPLSGLNWMGATAGFVLKKQGQTSKVKKIGANEELSSKTGVVPQLSLISIIPSLM